MTMSDNDKRIIPPFVNVGKQERMIDPRTLTNGQRQMLWLGIKTAEPELATMLQTDTNIDALKKQLGATERFTVADCHRYLEAGLKKFEERKP